MVIGFLDRSVSFEPSEARGSFRNICLIFAVSSFSIILGVIMGGVYFLIPGPVHGLFAWYLITKPVE